MINDGLRTFKKIDQRLKLPAKYSVVEHSKETDEDLSRVSNRFDWCIWTGDFNFRVKGTAKHIFTLIKANKFEVLKQSDKLSLKFKASLLPTDFKEGEIEFAPTYKIKNGTDEYNQKKRLPAWWDRIIFKSKDDILEQISYDSINTMKGSDHRPVFSQFELKFKYDRESVDEHDIIDLNGFKSTKLKDEIDEIFQMSKKREKNLGKNKSKAWTIF